MRAATGFRRAEEQQGAPGEIPLTADFTGWEHDNAKFEEPFERVVKALRSYEDVAA